MAGAQIRLGVVGNGDAARVVLSSAAKSGHFELVGAADTEPRARARFEEKYHGPTYETLAELLSGSKPDGVYIATPTKLHEELVLQCLEAGVHVLVEKPISTTLRAAEAMVEAASNRGLTLMVDHKRSVDRPIIAMWQVIQSGQIGAAKAIHRWHFSDWFYRPRGGDERDPDFGGVVLRQGAHEFDVIRLLASASTPLRMRGQTGDYDAERPGEGAYYSWVDYADGSLATSIYGGYGHFFSDEWMKGQGPKDRPGRSKRGLKEEVPTAEAEAELKRVQAGMPTVEPSGGVYGYTLVNCEYGDMRPSPGGGVYVYGDDGIKEYTVSGVDGTGLIVEELFRAISSGEAPLHDGWWGLACLEQCLAVRESSRTGREVALSRQGSVSPEAARSFLGDYKLEVVD